MLTGWKSRLLVLGWCAFLGAFTFVAATDFALIRNAQWCGGADQHCFREWVSALSGWAATIAAAFTIFFLYRQNAEQKKQSDFALGNADPTMDVTGDLEDPETIVVRIVNWNRRGVILHGISFSGTKANSTFRIQELKIDESLWDFEEKYGLPYLRGWEDRQSPPHAAQYKLTGYDEHPFFVWPEATEVVTYLELIDDKHKHVVRRASLYPPAWPLTGENTLVAPPRPVRD